MKTWARQSVSIQRKLIYTAIHIHTYVHYAHYIIHTCTCTTHAHTCTHVCMHVSTYMLPTSHTHSHYHFTHPHPHYNHTHPLTHNPPQPIPVPTSLTANTTIHSFAPLTRRCLQTLTPQAVKALHAQVPQVFMQFVVASNALNRLQSPHMTLPYH